MSDIRVIILAAGKGTRMKSDLPKVVHRIDDKCLVDYVIEAARGAGAKDVCLVVGYKADEVKGSIANKDVSFAMQTEQLGTGHAVMCASDFLVGDGQTLILCGDTPLITATTLKSMIDYHIANHNSVTALSAIYDDPTGYGRIIRDAQGNFIKNVEHKDASEEERLSKEINAGMYLFDTQALKEALADLTTDNAQGEYYLPDTLKIIREKGLRADAFITKDGDDIMGVNDQEQLALAASIIRKRNE